MRARDLLDRASIVGVWHAMGGSPLRHGRGRAWWRGGDSDNIALDDDRGCWYDHARGKGGGILDLIQTVLGCDRRDALRWLADHLVGVTLDDDRLLTRSEKREYAKRRRRAESAARNLTGWRREIGRCLRADRNRLYLSENASSAVGRTLLAATGGVGDDEAWAHIFEHARSDHRADQIDREIQRLESATPGELVAMRQESSEAA